MGQGSLRCRDLFFPCFFFYIGFAYSMFFWLYDSFCQVSFVSYLYFPCAVYHLCYPFDLYDLFILFFNGQLLANSKVCCYDFALLGFL